MAEGDGARGGGRRVYVRWSQGVGRRLCERLAAGELLYVICRDPGMPTPEAVAKWAREKPEFDSALRSARRAGGRVAGARGPVSSYCAETGEAVFERMCEGESLTAIGRDPVMPCLSTLMRWRRFHAEFDELVRLGQQIQAQRFCDLGMEMAMQATPETAYLTHVRLGQLRWTAGVMAPRQFRPKQMEPEGARERLDIVIRTFKSEFDPLTGRDKVVAYCPNPWTGQVEREDAPGWRPPAGVVSIPGGGDG